MCKSVMCSRKRRSWGMALCLTWVFGSLSAHALSSTAGRYLEDVLSFVQNNAVVSAQLDWTKLRREVLSKASNAKNSKDTYPAIEYLFEQLRVKDHHSTFYTPQDAKKMQAKTRGTFGFRWSAYPQENVVTWVIPGSSAERAGMRGGDQIEKIGGQPPKATSLVGINEVTLQLRRKGIPSSFQVKLKRSEININEAPKAWLLGERVGVLELPGTTGQGMTPQGSYSELGQEALRILDMANPLCGWVVDLRKNDGGNMWPMLAAVGPVLGEGKVGSFAGGGGLSFLKDWKYSEGKAILGFSVRSSVKKPYTLKHLFPPVAVLTSSQTASSGEALAVAFKGRDKTRFFGETTLGIPTSNDVYTLSDGAVLVVTTMLDADRTGQTYFTSMVPDESVKVDWSLVNLPSDPVLLQAQNWLKIQSECKE